MKALFATALTASLLSTAAFAADLPTRAALKAPPLVSVYNWSGLYVGVVGGYGWGDGSINGLAGSGDLSGGTIGGTIGYNWQVNSSPLVLGIEGDASWANFGKSESLVAPGVAITAETRAKFFGTARVRVGYAFDNALIFVTGGAAWMNNEISGAATVTPPGVTLSLSDSRTHTGYTIGGGLEYAFNRNWSTKIEYLYSDFGSQTYFGNVLGGFEAKGTMNTIRAGINYRF
jgi:outer membrane immunogenic protein